MDLAPVHPLLFRIGQEPCSAFSLSFAPVTGHIEVSLQMGHASGFVKLWLPLVLKGTE